MEQKINKHICDCGEEAIRKTGNDWVCPNCFSLQNRDFARIEFYKKKSEPKIKFGRKKALTEERIDITPILGIGDSLIELDKKLSAIDEETKLRLLQIAINEYETFHDAGMP